MDDDDKDDADFVLSEEESESSDEYGGKRRRKDDDSDFVVEDDDSGSDWEVSHSQGSRRRSSQGSKRGKGRGRVKAIYISTTLQVAVILLSPSTNKEVTFCLRYKASYYVATMCCWGWGLEGC